MRRRPTMNVRLDVDVERWPVCLGGQRVAQAEHSPSSEGHLEQLQQDDALGVGGQIASGFPLLVGVPVLIQALWKVEVHRDHAEAAGVPRQLICLVVPAHRALGRLAPQEPAEVALADRAAPLLLEPQPDTLAVEDVAALELDRPRRPSSRGRRRHVLGLHVAEADRAPRIVAPSAGAPRQRLDVGQRKASAVVLQPQLVNAFQCLGQR
mmetsp:Transcript_110674/g.352460  ORF Transcript_110674/g.352460 Transcript_110674/m.352460 type:complete len:209 (-) Transcript_110674:1103-1729(-)